MYFENSVKNSPEKYRCYEADLRRVLTNCFRRYMNYLGIVSIVGIIDIIKQETTEFQKAIKKNVESVTKNNSI